MVDVNYIIASLVAKYNYKPLPRGMSEQARNLYELYIPKFLSTRDISQMLYADNGMLLTCGYTRIVVGDYGAYIEFTKNQSNDSTFMVKPGEEYRINDPRYSENVKYHWYTLPNSDVKIYKQIRTVSYADYRPDLYYVSVHEVFEEE